MPGTVKSGLLSDTVRLCKCDSQEIDCWTLILTLDRGHFITDLLVHMDQASDLPVHAAAEKQMELPFGSPIYRISNMTV